jgi:catabolite regulation protein CreA
VIKLKKIVVYNYNILVTFDKREELLLYNHISRSSRSGSGKRRIAAMPVRFASSVKNDIFKGKVK